MQIQRTTRTSYESVKKTKKKKNPLNILLCSLSQKKTHHTHKLLDNTWTIIYSRPVTITGKQHLVIVDYTFAHTFAAANLSVRPGRLFCNLSLVKLAMLYFEAEKCNFVHQMQ